MRATRAASSDELVVGFSGSAGSVLLPAVLHAFGERHPSVSVEVSELLLDQIDKVASGQVDVAFTRLVPGQSSLRVEVLAREPRVVAVPISHRFASRDAVRLADLRRERFITNPLVRDGSPPERWLREQREHGLPGRVAAEAASIQEILALVASGRGVCLLPERAALDHPRDDLAYVEVTDAEPAVVSLAWAMENQRPAVRAFLAIAREVAAQSAIAGNPGSGTVVG